MEVLVAIQFWYVPTFAHFYSLFLLQHFTKITVLLMPPRGVSLVMKWQRIFNETS